MKNGHNDMREPIHFIPFVFSTGSFLADGFSTLRFAHREGRIPPEKSIGTYAPPAFLLCLLAAAWTRCVARVAVEGKGYHLVTLNAPELRPGLSDLSIGFRLSPTRRMFELHALLPCLK
jgi:hypothetical protein